MEDIPIFVLLIALSGLFSGAETAFFSITESQVHILENAKRGGAKALAWLKKRPQRLLITILVGNNIVNIFTASYATVVALEAFGSAGVGIATGVITILILIAGEILPKSLAFGHNQVIALRLAPIMKWLSIIVYPIVWPMLRLSITFKNIFAKHEMTGVTEEEIRVMAKLGLKEGSIDKEEQEMIESIFELDDRKVKQVMLPREDIVELDGTVPIDEIAHSASHTGYSRFPVNAGNGTIVGRIHANTILKVLNSDERGKELINFISPMGVMGENTNIEDALRLMRRKREHMFLVHSKDDESQILGLITMEDLLEVIVGDIEDETDSIG